MDFKLYVLQENSKQDDVSFLYFLSPPFLSSNVKYSI